MKFGPVEMVLAIVLAVAVTAVLFYVTSPPGPVAEIGTALVCDRVDDALVVCVER